MALTPGKLQMNLEKQTLAQALAKDARAWAECVRTWRATTRSQ